MNTHKQIKTTLAILGVALASTVFVACKKSNTTQISVPIFTIGKTVAPGNISGTIKGTLKGDSVYNVTGDVTINKGDTLLCQPGAKIYFKGNYNFWIHGNLISLGTKAKPVFFTVKENVKTDNVGQDPTTDVAYKGTWGGLQCDTTTKFLILKWTHLEYGGAKIATSQTFGVKSGATAWMVSFVNPKGIFVLEDSWTYGGVDDQIRVQGGQIHFMRNTVEKGGFTGGEGIANIKSGTQGTVAYNLIIGVATNGVKPSNNGTRTQANIVAYNNTIVNGGYRRFLYGGAGNSLGRGGSINYEEGAEGQAFNNLIVDCKFGLRVVGEGNYLGNALVVADTAHLKYNNNYYYGDSLAQVNQFLPVGFLSKPQASDVPSAPSYLPAGYKLGSVYNAPQLVGKNDPQFVNYPLPMTYGTGANAIDKKLATIAAVGSYDFHLKSTSPAIGKGTTSYTPINNVPLSPTFGATEITPPGVDAGCYQNNGTGNKH